VEKDQIITTLITRYKAEIEEILIECEHIYRLTIDYELLDSRITELLDAAKSDGLDEKTIWSLIQAQIPSYVNYINSKTTRHLLRPTGKKAA
jgi:hypothetical protein